MEFVNDEQFITDSQLAWLIKTPMSALHWDKQLKKVVRGRSDHTWETLLLRQEDAMQFGDDYEQLRTAALMRFEAIECPKEDAKDELADEDADDADDEVPLETA